MNKQFLVDLFLKKSVPDRILHIGSYQTILRSRVLFALFLSNIVICVFLFGFYSVAMWLTNLDFRLGMIATLASGSLLALQLYVFFKVANYQASATFFSMTFFMLTLAGVLFSGGWHSPILTLFFCAPAIAFIVSGRNEGFYMAALVYVCGLLLLFAQVNHFPLWQIVPEQRIPAIRGYIWITATILLTSCLGVYDSLLRNVAKHRKRDEKPLSRPSHT